MSPRKGWVWTCALNFWIDLGFLARGYIISMRKVLVS